MEQEQSGNYLTWENLFKNGCLVHVKMKIPGFTYRVRANDLGLKDQEKVDKAISSAARTIDRKHLKTLCNRAYMARKIVELNSIEFPIIDGARFVPLSKKEKCVDEVKKNQEQFYEYLNNKFIPHYNEMLEEMKPILQSALEALTNNNQEIVENVMKKIIKRCPSKEDLIEKISLVYRVFNIATPDETKNNIDLLLKQEKDIKKMMEEMIVSLRTEVLEKIENIRELLMKNDDKIGMKTVNTTKKFLEEIKDRNIFGDNVIEEKSVQLLKVLNRNVKESDVIEELKTTMKDVSTALETDANEIVEKAAEDFKIGVRVFK